MNSLRSKIILSYSISIFALLFASLVVYVDLKSLLLQIIENENINVLLYSTQQMQNHEENLLLHRTTDAYFLLRAQVDSTHDNFIKFRPSFENLAESNELDKLDSNLRYYKRLLEEVNDIDGQQIQKKQQDALRATSEFISNIIRQLSQRHHVLLSEITELVLITIAIGLLVATLVSIGSAIFVIRRVIRPIRLLEKQLDAVADGELSKLTLTTRDTEIQSFVKHFNTMLDRLRAQQSQLRHHEKAAALGVLVSGVAHELNNPLSNISTSVQLLLEDEHQNPDLHKQWLAHVDSESERARRIVRRLLDSVRQPSTSIQSISAARLVRSATMLVHRQIDPGIFIDIEDVSDSCINVNLERFQQVFINLIHNAVDAGAGNIWIFGDTTTWDDSKPADTESVQGDISSISEAEELMLFTIADDGPGIPEDNLSQVFTPFFTTKTSGEGTGLGLYLVHEIVEEHDGCISVENRSDGGTQFLIWLPIAKKDCTT